MLARSIPRLRLFERGVGSDVNFIILSATWTSSSRLIRRSITSMDGRAVGWRSRSKVLAALVIGIITPESMMVLPFVPSGKSSCGDGDESCFSSILFRTFLLPFKWKKMPFTRATSLPFIGKSRLGSPRFVAARAPQMNCKCCRRDEIWMELVLVVDRACNQSCGFEKCGELLGSLVIIKNCLPTWACLGLGYCELVETKRCRMFDRAFFAWMTRGRCIQAIVGGGYRPSFVFTLFNVTYEKVSHWYYSSSKARGVFMFKFSVRASCSPLKLRLWLFDPDPGESSLRSGNIQIVRWKIQEHLEILGDLIVFMAWEVIISKEMSSFLSNMSVSSSRDVDFILFARYKATEDTLFHYRDDVNSYSLKSGTNDYPPSSSSEVMRLENGKVFYIERSSSLEGERQVLVVVVLQLVSSRLWRSGVFLIDLEQDISFIGLEQDISFIGLEQDISFVGLERDIDFVQISSYEDELLFLFVSMSSLGSHLRKRVPFENLIQSFSLNKSRGGSSVLVIVFLFVAIFLV
ncbi:hypothetical protein F2Q68_00034956 [Brassica cretica]|uniref:Uncharacterized protein n=1 Tax=Brassica cretica TaxID=69181 RepID=A0A8S9GTE5_BRACR|nr:hypothetical protein F2Q68_00034956 [Brassica cretica]